MDTTLSAPIGQLLDGRYLVESQIARGGMATVYHARDVRLERTVAVKIAHPELARDDGFVARFISEARSAARLSSPNVVAVFDQGSTGDLHYIAMEYVPGPTLRELLVARGRLQPRQALDIIQRVLAGLAAAHDADIIHRDVKPENVLLGNGTSVKVADFGLARAAAAVSHTKTGMLIGTAAYLAPEQVASNRSDKRTDVYAAGVMLFEMLTGVQPHTGESPLAVAYKHVNNAVPAPSSLVPGLPAALDTLVALGTSRDPDLRPPDARQYLKAIIQVRRGLPVPARGAHSPGTAAATPAGNGPSGNGRGGAGAAATGATAAGAAGAAPAAEAALLARREDDGRPHDGGGLAALGLARDADATGPIEGLTGQLQPGAHQGSPVSTQHLQHTMIVPAGLAGDDYADSGRRAAGGGRRRQQHEPWLQRWLFSRRILIVLAVVLLGAGVWWLTEGQYQSIPSVVGLTAGAARGQLSSDGLTVSGTSANSNTVRSGLVISTTPGAGTRIRHGGKVIIVTSLGPKKIAVPSVTGESLANADSALKAAGLTPAAPGYQTSGTIAKGLVISTSPVANTSWPQDKPVHLVVSDGPPLPDFAGQQLSAAEATAAAGGYSISAVTVAKSDVQAGTILRQSPAAGQPISPGEVVTVYVSPGPPEVSIPNVRGDTAAQAEHALTAAGFQVTVDQGLFGHRVTKYSPTGQAPQGSAITIVLGFTF